MLDAMAARLAEPPHQVTFTARGHSMEPLVRDGQQVTVRRLVRPEFLHVGDIVLARVRGTTYLHKITAVDKAGRRVQIGNNKGYVNGWTGWDKVYGYYAPPRD
jgi:1,6-anhydro-N-acetylmuramate kinase